MTHWEAWGYAIECRVRRNDIRTYTPSLIKQEVNLNVVEVVWFNAFKWEELVYLLLPSKHPAQCSETQHQNLSLIIQRIIQWQMVKTRTYSGYFYIITYIVACLRSALMVLKRKCNQGCTVPNLCSWATRKSYNVLFSYKSYDGHPGLNKFRALGSLQFFLEHSWGLQKHDKLTTFFLHIPVTFPLPKSLFIFPSIC